jgi:hypothetical protein
MDDFPWHYAAMIFIVFVSWLYQRLQEISASRRLRSAERKAAAEAARKERPLFQESRPPLGPPPVPGPVPQPAPAAPTTTPGEIAIPRSFREFFETIETLSNPPVKTPAPLQETAPPPLPVAPPEPEKRSNPVVKPIVEAKPTAPHPASGLSTVLRRRSSLRQALILKEILDVPVSLR